MKFFTKIKRSVLAKFLIVFMITGVVFMPVRHTLEVNRAEAIFADYWLVLKDSTLDAIVWYIINLVLEEIIMSVTDWVNNGFDGRPAFVTDLGGFLVDIGDKVAGDFIWKNGPLDFLCSPFKLNVQLALDHQYKTQRDYKAQCTVSGIVSNLDGFLEGDFSSGGWEGWYNVTMDRNNNPYGATMEAKAALSATIRNARGQEINLLQWGDGFFADKDCDPETERCTTKTPGSVIESSLNNALELGNERLTVADEFNELFSALFSQLMSSVLQGGLTNYKASDYQPYPPPDVPTPEQARAEQDAANANGTQAIQEEIEQQNSGYCILGTTYPGNSCQDAQGKDAFTAACSASDGTPVEDSATCAVFCADPRPPCTGDSCSNVCHL